MSTHKEFTFDHHHTRFFGQQWQPKEPKAVVILVHGFGEHSGRYADFVVPKLLTADLAVVSYDNFGHGKTEGKRGHCPSYDALMYVLARVLHLAEDAFPGLPLFLYGHSMGGNLVLNYALRKEPQIAGVIATSPYLRLGFKPPGWKMRLGKLMLNLLPSITLPSGLEETAISRIPEEVEKYKKDPLVHDRVSPMFSLPIMQAGEWAIAHASELLLPTLLLHGTDDRLIDHKATVQFDKHAPQTTLHLFDSGYHELHNDLERETAMKTITDWTTNRLK